MVTVEGPFNTSPTQHPGAVRYVVDVVARDRLLAVLNGSDQEQKEYLRTRSFSLDELPEWLRKETYHVAKVEFEKTSKAAVLEDMYHRLLALSKGPGVWRNFLANAISPCSRAKDFFCKDFARSLVGIFPVRFSEEIFRGAGFHRSTTLEQLLNARGEVRDPASEHSGTPRHLGVYVTDCARGRLELPVFLPPFDPRAGGALGGAAVTAREVAGSRIVAFSLVSDLTRALGIPLEETKVRKLALDLQEDPFVKAKNSPILRSLSTYSEHILSEGAPSSIPLDEVFAVFAFHKQPINEMQAENRRREKATEPRPVIEAPLPSREAAPLLPPVDDTTVRLKDIIAAGTGEDIDAVGAGMRLLRVCVSHAIPPRELERLLKEHAGDAMKVVRAIQRGAATDEDTTTGSMAKEGGPLVTTPAVTPRYTVYAHGGDNGFTKWHQGLPEEERLRVSEVVSDVAFGRLGKSRVLKARNRAGINEIRVMDLGLRVYFGYLPDHRIILLCGGNKSDQERDIARAHRYAREYFDHRHGSLDASLLFPVEHPKSDQ